MAWLNASLQSKEVARLVDPDITAESLPAFVQQKD